MGDILKEQLTLEEILRAFTSREDGYGAATQKILSLLAPTVLTALYDFFGVPEERVEWMDIQLSGNMVIILATVIHRSDEAVPPVLEQLAPRNSSDIESIERLVRIGVPIAVIMKTPEEICEFLKHNMRTTNEDPQPKAPQLPANVLKQASDVPVNANVPKKVIGFDVEKLSKEQLDALMMYVRINGERI